MLCNIVRALTDKARWPIPGTDRVLNRYPCHHCEIVELPPTQMVPDVGEVQSFHPKRLRFFYRVDCTTGRTIPSSLFTSYKHPGGGVLEYKKFVTV